MSKKWIVMEYYPSGGSQAYTFSTEWDAYTWYVEACDKHPECDYDRPVEVS